MNGDDVTYGLDERRVVYVKRSKWLVAEFVQRH